MDEIHYDEIPPIELPPVQWTPPHISLLPPVTTTWTPPEVIEIAEPIIQSLPPAVWMPPLAEALDVTEDEAIAIVGQASGVPYFGDVIWESPTNLEVIEDLPAWY